jgi:sterol desaturase/sphingolipid hydroxylase (fatty acid hydroxylase superfamily)
LILASYGPFFHANLRLGFGKANVLLVSPQVHRIHHSRLPQHADTNFVIAFPIWDILFGTYHHPAPDEFPPTGVEGEPEILSLTDAALLPFREWRKLLRRRRGVREFPAATASADAGGPRCSVPQGNGLA